MIILKSGKRILYISAVYFQIFKHQKVEKNLSYWITCCWQFFFTNKIHRDEIYGAQLNTEGMRMKVN